MAGDTPNSEHRDALAAYSVFDAAGNPLSGSLTAGTAAELSAGTETGIRTWSPKLIHDEIARQITAAG